MRVTIDLTIAMRHGLGLAILALRCIATPSRASPRGVCACTLRASSVDLVAASESPAASAHQVVFRRQCLDQEVFCPEVKSLLGQSQVDLHHFYLQAFQLDQ